MMVFTPDQQEWRQFGMNNNYFLHNIVFVLQVIFTLLSINSQQSLTDIIGELISKYYRQSIELRAKLLGEIIIVVCHDYTDYILDFSNNFLYGFREKLKRLSL